MTEVTYKVRLQGSDGKEYVMEYDALKQTLGVCMLETSLQSARDVLFRKIETLEKIEIDRLKITYLNPLIDYVRTNPDVRTGDLHAKIDEMGRNFSNLHRIALYRLFNELKESGELVPTSHGSGKHRTWRIKDHA